jgi:hypothetical protein
MTINEQFIENIVNTCDKYGFLEDEINNVKNKKFLESIEKIVNSIISLGEENAILLYKDKIDKEIPLIRIDKDIIGSSLFFSLFISMYDHILRKYYKEDKYNYVISNLLKYSLIIYQEIISLVLSKSVNGILSRIRTIYETWVIQEFIIKNKHLAVNFLEHKRIITFKLIEEIGKKLNKKEEKIKAELLNKYSDDFIYEFGWTSSVIKNFKKRNPQGLVNYLNLDTINNYNFIYKIACQFVHTTSFGIFSNDETNIEMIDVFIITTVEIITNMFIKFMEELEVKDKDKIILSTILFEIIEEVKSM